MDIDRLTGAMRRARKSLQRFREERREAVRQFVGKHWSEDGTRERVPVNLISLYVSVVGKSLIAKNPRVMLSTFLREHKPTVSAMESWANKEVEAMRLAETLQRVVTDALFSIGICKVALATPAESASVAWNLAAGQPFAERVDLDDFVFDVHARDFNEAGFIGHRYRVPLDVVKDSKLYSKYRKQLAPSTDSPYNLEGDERVGHLGRGLQAGDSEEFEDFVDLWEVYVPRHRQIFTLADDQMGGDAGEPLRVQRWLGPDQGPYHVLGLGVVPGNAMPKGPIQDLIDLHEAANRAYRKAIRTIDRVKEVTAVQGGAMEDGSRVMQADDGEIIRLDNPERIKQIVFGGNSLQSVLLMGTTLKDLFSWQAGNLDIMGGLSPQSKTAHQDAMLNENSSKSVADMQDRTVSFTASVVRALCWYWHHDPIRVMAAQHSPQGLPELSLLRKVGPAQRQRVSFEDMEIRVDPYSLQHATPQSRMQSLNQIVQTIVLPMMQLLQQQGVAFDINAYLKKISQYMDMPDLSEIITIQEPPSQGEMGGGGGAPPMPAQTERRYVRESRPGRTERGNTMNLVSSLMGVNPGGAPKNGQPMGAGG